MEVLEHLVDPQQTLYQLIRISRKRVIITVPWNQKIKQILCIHCAEYTPASGHLHSFNENNIKQCLDSGPEKVEIKKMLRFGSLFLYFVPRFVPYSLVFLADRLLCGLLARYAQWMLVVVDLK